MSKPKQQLLTMGISLVVIGIVVASYKNCNRGCQSLADHLIDHGLQDVIAGLF